MRVAYALKYNEAERAHSRCFEFRLLPLLCARVYLYQANEGGGKRDREKVREREWDGKREGDEWRRFLHCARNWYAVFSF